MTEIAPAAPPFDLSRPVWWKVATANLNVLGYRKPFTAMVDLQLAEDLARGSRIDVLAEDLAIAAIDLKNRWRALLACLDVREGDRPTIEQQTHLIEILRHRAGVAAQAAE